MNFGDSGVLGCPSVDSILALLYPLLKKLKSPAY